MVLEVRKPRPLWEILFSTHHTDIGLLYIIFSLTLFFLGGTLAISIRTELFLPGAQLFSDSNTFHRFFTVHGTTMLFLWVLPFSAGIGNYLDTNYGKIQRHGMAKAERSSILDDTCWQPLWSGLALQTLAGLPILLILSIRAPGPAAEMWIFGLKILGISSILGAINFVVTILRMKHPDLPMMKLPLFAWATLSTSLIILMSMPTFAAALIMLYTDRLGVSGFFNPAMGGDPLAYQHLFWFTFHPEVYVFVIPAIGMIYEIIPKFFSESLYSVILQG